MLLQAESNAAIILRWRAPARWLRAAGTVPARLDVAAGVSRLVLSRDGSTVAEWWGQAAGEATAASFKTTLGLLHKRFSSDLVKSCLPSTPSNYLLAVSDMVAGLLHAWAMQQQCGQEATIVARVCAALVLASPDFRADLLWLLQHKAQPAGKWVATATAALYIDGGSASTQVFVCDGQVVEALVDRLAAGAGPELVGVMVGLAGCMLLLCMHAARLQTLSVAADCN